MALRRTKVCCLHGHFRLQSTEEMRCWGSRHWIVAQANCISSQDYPWMWALILHLDISLHTVPRSSASYHRPENLYWWKGDRTTGCWAESQALMSVIKFQGPSMGHDLSFITWSDGHSGGGVGEVSLLWAFPAKKNLVILPNKHPR